jgi:hypothetical protein
MSDSKKHVEDLIKKAAEAPNAEAAMKWGQAALNAANALCSLKVYEAS